MQKIERNEIIYAQSLNWRDVEFINLMQTSFVVYIFRRLRYSQFIGQKTCLAKTWLLKLEKLGMCSTCTYNNFTQEQWIADINYIDLFTFILRNFLLPWNKWICAKKCNFLFFWSWIKHTEIRSNENVELRITKINNL